MRGLVILTMILILLGCLGQTSRALICSECDDKQSENFEAHRNTASLLYQDLDRRVLKVEMLIYGASVILGLLSSMIFGPWIRKKWFSMLLVIILTLGLLTAPTDKATCSSCEMNPCFNDQQCSLGCACVVVSETYLCSSP